MRAKEFLNEFATAGSTNTGGMGGTVEFPVGNKRGKGGKAPKPFKVKSVNATTSNVSIFGAVGENQAVALIKR